MKESFKCQYLAQCNGCPWGGLTQNEQHQAKIDTLQNEFKGTRIDFLSPPDNQLNFRERFDFTYTPESCGLYSKNKQSLVDIHSCSLITTDLNKFYQDFRQIKWPIRKGSVRLRVSPNILPSTSSCPTRGAWLDFSNEDIKNLISNKSELLQLLNLGIVEIGQKKKRLQLNSNNELKLKDPELFPWSATFLNKNSDYVLALYSSISNFTQSGSLANKLIIKKFVDYIADIPTPAQAIEFGAGIGNLSFPAASIGFDVTCCEIDESATFSLKYNLSKLENTGFDYIKNKITTRVGNFHKPLIDDFSKYDLIILNPARSGVGDFLKKLFEINSTKKPQYVFYMSCYLDSFLKDTQALKNNKYSLKTISIVDQFPNSPHFEILSFWEN